MYKVLLQIWEESSIDRNIPNGCTLHVDEPTFNSYIKMRYDNRVISKVYDSAISKPLEIEVKEGLFNIISSNKNVRLNQHELNNLVELGDIIIS